MRWTEADMKVLRALYPDGGVEAVYAALNGRHSRGSIRQTAWRHWIRCEVPILRLRKKEDGNE
jgi:hypothetical protein